jgi:hypothetical protein
MTWETGIYLSLRKMRAAAWAAARGKRIDSKPKLATCTESENNRTSDPDFSGTASNPLPVRPAHLLADAQPQQQPRRGRFIYAAP